MGNIKIRRSGESRLLALKTNMSSAKFDDLKNVVITEQIVKDKQRLKKSKEQRKSVNSHTLSKSSNRNNRHYSNIVIRMTVAIAKYRYTDTIKWATRYVKVSEQYYQALEQLRLAHDYTKQISALEQLYELISKDYCDEYLMNPYKFMSMRQFNSNDATLIQYLVESLVDLFEIELSDVNTTSCDFNNILTVESLTQTALTSTFVDMVTDDEMIIIDATKSANTVQTFNFLNVMTSYFAYVISENSNTVANIKRLVVWNPYTQTKQVLDLNKQDLQTVWRYIAENVLHVNMSLFELA